MFVWVSLSFLMVRTCLPIFLGAFFAVNSWPWFEGKQGGSPNVIFEERLNGKFSENAVEFNFEGGPANLANPTNFSGNSPDSPDSTRECKF